MSPHVSLRHRAGLLLALPALTISGLTLAASPAAAADHATAPVGAGADWLTSKLSDGLLTYPSTYGPYTDHGLSIDAGLGLAAIGGREDTVQAISDGLEAQLESYISGEAFGDAGSTYSGPAGKALVMAQTAGEDGTTYGGGDLVERVESTVAATPPITGRIQDVSQYGDYANVLGQAYVTQGLAAAGSPRATDALAFLLQQQCDEGFFRLNFTKNAQAVDQTCDGGTAKRSAPDTDATALVILALQAQAGAPVVAAALDDAEAWLLDAQRGNGSFGGGPSTEAANTNSTGVAGWALGETGHTEAAEAAAGWIRRSQTANAGACDWWNARDLGAVAYDPSSKDVAAAGGIADDTLGQWLRASAQALPALQWAPALAGERQVLAAPGYVRAGRKTSVGVLGADPGESLCVTQGDYSTSGVADQHGEASLKVRLGKGEGPRVVTGHDETGEIGSVQLFALAKLAVPFRIKKKVAPGRKQVVRVTGMAPGEDLRVTFRGRRVVTGQADDQGAWKGRFKVRRPLGKAKVVVVGEFKNRRAAKTFTVSRKR